MGLIEPIIDCLTAFPARFPLALGRVCLILELPACSCLAEPAGGNNMLPFNSVASLVVLPSL